MHDLLYHITFTFGKTNKQTNKTKHKQTKQKQNKNKNKKTKQSRAFDRELQASPLPEPGCGAFPLV